ncbi:unnamed protein product [Ilex paraguariensis]|uniref:Uncharacterized protein n=1 Tax=Ilex paraguariensis TaxID=185542 RepID=A0ABC8RBH5_9AQUA
MSNEGEDVHMIVDLGEELGSIDFGERSQVSFYIGEEQGNAGATDPGHRANVRRVGHGANAGRAVQIADHVASMARGEEIWHKVTAMCSDLGVLGKEAALGVAVMRKALSKAIALGAAGVLALHWLPK